MSKVKIYSTPSCGYCNIAKNFFNENKIKFEEYDVSTDKEKRAELIEKSKQMGVPVIVIDDKVIVGFDEAKISSLLKIKK